MEDLPVTLERRAPRRRRPVLLLVLKPLLLLKPWRRPVHPALAPYPSSVLFPVHFPDLYPCPGPVLYPCPCLVLAPVHARRHYHFSCRHAHDAPDHARQLHCRRWRHRNQAGSRLIVQVVYQPSCSVARQVVAT